MKLSPFVFVDKDGKIKNSQRVNCFDENSPCILEQISECVIRDSANQDKYVPWLICMDTKGENTGDVAKCSASLGIDYSKVDQTPTVFVNGVNIGPKNGPTFQLVKAAICK